MGIVVGCRGRTNLARAFAVRTASAPKRVGPERSFARRQATTRSDGMAQPPRATSAPSRTVPVYAATTRRGGLDVRRVETLLGRGKESIMLKRRAFWVVIALLGALRAYAEPEADRFVVSGISEAGARSMLQALQDGLRSDDHEKLAALVEYPLRVNSSGTHTLISDPGQFVADFPSIFTREVRQQVLAQRFDELFVNWRGVMVGNGALWFSAICDADSSTGTCKKARVRIIAVNLNVTR